jgi:transposase
MDRTGRISKRGDRMVRTALFEAAQAVMIRLTRWCTLKAWGMKIARKRGLRRAIVAVARRLGVILHRMWASGTAYRWGQPATA